MNILNKLAITISSATCLLTTIAAPVSAAIFNFSYTGVSVLDPNDTVTASGILTTSDYDPSTNSYEILSISGTRNGEAIDSLLAPGAFLDNDNLLLADSPPLSEFGFSYSIGGLSYNVFYTYDYIEILYTGSAYGGYPLTSFSIKPVTIPEPSLISGIAVIGVVTGGAFLKRFYRFCYAKS